MAINKHNNARHRATNATIYQNDKAHNRIMAKDRAGFEKRPKNRSAIILAKDLAEILEPFIWDRTFVISNFGGVIRLSAFLDRLLSSDSSLLLFSDIGFSFI